MDILALILACSLHPDDAFVRVMVDVQSGGNVYFVGDLATLKTRDDLSSADEALRAAEDISRHGGRPAVGLLGLPVEWAARFGHQPRDLFDACTNLEIGSAMFSEYHYQCSDIPGRARSPKWSRPSVRRPRRPSVAALRSCVLTKLSRDLGLQSTPVEVLKMLSSRSAPPAGESAPHTSDIFTAGTADAAQSEPDWSNPRMYLNPLTGIPNLTDSAPPGPAPPPPRRSTMPPVSSQRPAGQ